VLADCDVDAADLHLVLEPDILRREPFVGSKRARILPDQCAACGECKEVCRFEAISLDGPGNDVVEKTFRIDPLACEGCGVCAFLCPMQAIEFAPVVNGEWFISQTRFGPMVHAKLGVAEENSGKLASIVRTNAERVAEERGFGLVLIDGSPGIGCPVIASITGASLGLGGDGADSQQPARPRTCRSLDPALPHSHARLCEQVGPQYPDLRADRGLGARSGSWTGPCWKRTLCCPRSMRGTRALFGM
jgi:ferredoxin